MLRRGSVRLHSSITVGCHEAESNSLPDRNPGLQTAPVLCSLTLACAVPMSAHPEAIERIARNVSGILMAQEACNGWHSCPQRPSRPLRLNPWSLRPPWRHQPVKGPLRPWRAASRHGCRSGDCRVRSDTSVACRAGMVPAARQEIARCRFPLPSATHGTSPGR